MGLLLSETLEAGAGAPVPGVPAELTGTAPAAPSTEAVADGWAGASAAFARCMNLGNGMDSMSEGGRGVEPVAPVLLVTGPVVGVCVLVVSSAA